MRDVPVTTPVQRRTWNALRTMIGGRAGLVIVPVWSFDSAPYASGQRERPIFTEHDDDTPFDDEAPYVQGSIVIETAGTAALGATQMTIRLVNASQPAGIRFSYQHALYETGAVIEQLDDETFTVGLFPAVRAAVPVGATLEADLPTCLSRLVDDRGMDLALSSSEIDFASVEFVEAVDYWNDLALEEA